MIYRLFYASDPSDKFSLFVKINIILILAVSIFFRIVALDHIPGVNGDEAWYGVQMKHLYHEGTCDWQTPNGNPLNPFFAGIIYVFHLFFSPHILVLRTPAVLSGLLFILLTYVFTKKMADPITATMATVLAAVFPANIAYSRFGWDASQIGLVSCLVIYFAWRRNWPALAASMLAAFLVHPSTVFLIPVVIVPIIADMITDPKTSEKRVGRKIIAGVAGVCLLIFGFFTVWPLANRVLDGPALLERLASPLQWYEFFMLFGQLLSGVTVSKYISGHIYGDAVFIYDVIFVIVFFTLVILGGRRLALYRRWKALAFWGGFLLSAAALFLIAGKAAVMPGLERYALYLMAPAGLAVAFTLRALGRTPGQQHALILITVVIGWFLIVSFQHTYFRTIIKTGGSSHWTSRTGKNEPKKEALDVILSNTEGKSKVLILAENFWLYYPIRYLAPDSKDFQVVNLKAEKYPVANLVSDMRDGAYAVGFTDGKVRRVMQYIPESRFYRQWTIKDYGGNDFIHIWHVEGNSRE